MKTITPKTGLQIAITLVGLVLLFIYGFEKAIGVSDKINLPSHSPEQKWINQTIEKLRTKNPEVVVIGNSMAGHAFDRALFESLSGKPTMNIWQKGSSSAWWYLVMEQLVLAHSRPELLLIIFRDNVLTQPNLRVWGHYKKEIDALVPDNQHIVNKLAYLNHKNADYYLSNYVPLYKDRVIWNDLVKSNIHDFLGENVFNVSGQDLRDSLYKVFLENGIKYRNIAEEGYYNSTRLEAGSLQFQRLLRDSLLPHFLKLSEKHQTPLLFVRIERLVDFQGLRENRALDQYVADLAGYLAENNTAFIDYTGRDQFSHEHFSTNDHLTVPGKKYFTRQLLKDIEAMDLL